MLTLYDELFDTSVPFPAVDPNVRGTGWPVEDPAMWKATGPWRRWVPGSGAAAPSSEMATDILENKTAVTALPVAEGGVPATYLEVKPIMLNA